MFSELVYLNYYIHVLLKKHINKSAGMQAYLEMMSVKELVKVEIIRF